MSRHAARPPQPGWERIRTARVAAAIVVVLIVGATVVALLITHRSSTPLLPAAQTSAKSTPVASSVASVVSSTENVQPPPPPPTATLQTDFAQLQQTLDAQIGLVIRPVGRAGNPVVLGNWSSGPAWSTVKVALAIAVLRAQGSPAVTENMRAAIVNSDNDAAEALWSSLGNPETAAGKVGEVLHGYGDPTIVQSQRIRAQFSAFGQTEWSLVDQATFVAGAVCEGQNDPIFDLMRHIASDQRWGIGGIADSQFKGGWGPDPSGGYLVRQIGVFSTDSGRVAIAMAAQPTSGSFSDGTADLNRISEWLKNHAAVLPSGQC